MTHSTIGWDIGGAHLKAVLIDAAGNAVQVLQVTCSLWKGLDVLALAIDEVLTTFNPVNNSVHAITMTGELADIFPDRHDGVLQIIDLVNTKLNGKKLYYAGQQGFVQFERVAENTSNIASANWFASAHYIAKKYPQALLIDMGSTTTDFMVIANGQPQCRGYSDAMRMQVDELVYTGMIRTPLMALTNRVPFAGEWCTLAAEHFATTADIYRLTGELNALEDMSDTADGKGKAILDSARRLARMIGRDVGEADITAWVALAQVFRQAQLSMLKNAAMRHFSILDGARPLLDVKTPIIAAGVGSQLLKELALQLNRPFINVTELISSNADSEKKWASVCFPAYAVANLAIN